MSDMDATVWNVIKFAAFLFLVGILLGICIGIIIEEHGDQQVAIRHGAAHYNANSGDFEWNAP